MTCDCAGRAHVVCRTKWRAAPRRIAFPRYRAGDPVAWAMAELRKIGPVPERFTYRPPTRDAAPLGGELDCACQGTRHPVCLSANKWRDWARAVHKYLDRVTVTPEADVCPSPHQREETAA